MDTNKTTHTIGQPTAMSIAIEIYDRVTAEGYEPIKSVRQDFLAAAIEEAGLTKNGASTYYQSCKNAAAGKPRYYTKKTDNVETKKADNVETEEVEAEKADNVETEPQAKMKPLKAEAESKKPEVVKHRWAVMSKEGEILEYFPSRTKAQVGAKALGGKWVDMNRINA